MERRNTGETRVRRGYFECRYGQLHVHNAIPPGGGFEEGTSMLCVHRAGASGRAFQGFLPVMGRDRSLYAPDLPGYGESDAAPAGVTAVDYAGALMDFLDSMRLRKIDVLGQHTGALIAMELAISRPQQVRQVVLAGVPQSAQERLRLVTQPLMVLRPKDELWESTGRLREWLPRARVVDLPEHGTSLFETAPEVAANAMKDFLRS